MHLRGILALPAREHEIMVYLLALTRGCCLWHDCLFIGNLQTLADCLAARGCKDRMYITKTEWATEWGGFKAKQEIRFRSLPFHCCGISFTPFEDPVGPPSAPRCPAALRHRQPHVCHLPCTRRCVARVVMAQAGKSATFPLAA